MTDLSKTRCSHSWSLYIIPIGALTLLSRSTFYALGHFQGHLQTFHVQLLLPGSDRHVLWWFQSVVLQWQWWRRWSIIEGLRFLFGWLLIRKWTSFLHLAEQWRHKWDIVTYSHATDHRPVSIRESLVHFRYPQNREVRKFPVKAFVQFAPGC